MISLRHICTGFALLLLSSSIALASGSTGISTTTSEQRLLADATDGAWNQFSLAEAALIASGVESLAERQQLLARLDQFTARARSEISPQQPVAKRADLLLHWMHREVLTSPYELRASGLDVSLRSGAFNCVSATILYCCLAQQLGMSGIAVEQPGHVLVVVRDGTQSHYVETTAGRSDEKSLAPPSTVAGERPLSATALIGLIYYNHGIDLLESGQFVAAAATNQRALTLDPGHVQARGNLLASWNNLALEMIAHEQFADAEHVLDRARAISPNHPPLVANERHLYARWFSNRLAAGDMGQARTMLDRLRLTGVDSRLIAALAARLPSGPSTP